MGSGVQMLLLIAAFYIWDLQAQTEPEVHFAELKIKRQDEHTRVKREQSCQILCIPNWILYNDTCYRVLSKPRSWINAEEYCQKLVPGGHLASIPSLET
ncbi:lectin-like [Mustelus asterias]